MPETEEKPRKRMGRPPKAPEKGRRQNYTFRMSDQTRDDVIAAAGHSGRSMSEELEWRIEASFRSNEINETIHNISTNIVGGNSDTLSVVTKVSAVINSIESYAKGDDPNTFSEGWKNNEATRAGVRAGITRLIVEMTSPIRDIAAFKKRYPTAELSKKALEEKLTEEDFKLMEEFHETQLIERMEIIGSVLALVASGNMPIASLLQLAPHDKKRDNLSL